MIGQWLFLRVVKIVTLLPSQRGAVKRRGGIWTPPSCDLAPCEDKWLRLDRGGRELTHGFSEKHLGMDVPIARRDFLQNLAPTLNVRSPFTITGAISHPVIFVSATPLASLTDRLTGGRDGAK